MQQRWRSCDDLAQERSLLREDEPVLLREIELGHAFLVLAQPRAIGLVGGQAFEGDQREGDVVGALVRHPIAQEIAAAARNNGLPALRILLELRALERIELIANEQGDGHGNPPLGNLGVIARSDSRSEEHTSELQSHVNLVCRLLLEKKKK